MAEQRTPETEDDNIEGTSVPATPLDDVQDARGDGSARDLVGAESDAERASVDGAYDDDDASDPAYQAVIEGGGGVAEGFEQSEAALIANATDSEGSTMDITFDAIDEVTETDEDIFGEADDVLTSDEDDDV